MIAITPVRPVIKLRSGAVGFVPELGRRVLHAFARLRPHHLGARQRA